MVARQRYCFMTVSPVRETASLEQFVQVSARMTRLFSWQTEQMPLRRSKPPPNANEAVIFRTW